jgi:hypothetical protein
MSRRLGTDPNMPPAGASVSNRAAMFTPSAVEIVSLDDHIAEMQADAKYNPLGFGTFRVHFVNSLLELNRRRQRVACASKFYERPITHQLDQPAPVSRERWFKAFPSMLAQSRQCSALVAPHQAGVADNIGSENCRQFALLMGTGTSPVLYSGS